MIIINADDWGRSSEETDAALLCFEHGRITSVSAMVFMEDSARAAKIAIERGIGTGLHLNLTQRLASPSAGAELRRRHERIAAFLNASKYAFLLYHPTLTKDLRYVYQAQVDEFVSLYGKPPTHVDGHHHQHLCTNMLVDGIIAPESKVRRSFHFWPGEKGRLNRMYRRLVDRSLSRRYRMTDYFFALPHCMRSPRMERVVDAARSASVEIMTHPFHAEERAFLMSDAFARSFGTQKLASYAAL
ncbi:MAG: ChbG/HpnK family deacetylase [Burkholderiales bacterium]